MEKQNSTVRTLPVKLTNSEIQMYGEEQASLLVQIGKPEDRRKMVNDEIKPRRERVDKLAKIIDSKQEERQVDCLWVYSWEAGVKRLTRMDTREVVETRKIEAEENQGDMFGRDGQDSGYGQ
jgi:hypothetical protein